jgi:GNAT superfamily N-acetyltransferase
MFRHSVSHGIVCYSKLLCHLFEASSISPLAKLLAHLYCKILLFYRVMPYNDLSSKILLIESFLSFIDDELVIIAEDIKGNHVGLLVCLPDIYQPFREGLMTRARIISIGVLPGWERNGVGAMMVSHLITNLLKKGYTSIEAPWILDSNKLSQNLARRFNAVSGREFALLEKRLC